MATLAADIPVVFNPAYPIGLTQAVPTATDVYFRGGIAHRVVATGKATLTPADGDFCLGVVMEHKSATTADLIWCSSTGVFWFANTNFTLANIRVLFAMQSTDLTDNPATMAAQGAGDAGAAGKLIVCDSDAVSGWLDMTDRVADTNA